MNSYLVTIHLLNILKPHFEEVSLDPEHVLWIGGTPLCSVHSSTSEGTTVVLGFDDDENPYFACDLSNPDSYPLASRLKKALSQIERERETGRLIWENALRSF